MYFQGKDQYMRDMQLEISDFYWENLGIPDYLLTKSQVIKRLEDFRGFIEKAILRLKSFLYLYGFSSYTELTLESQDLGNLPEPLIMCRDNEFGDIIFKGKLSRGQNRITLQGYQRISVLYVRGSDRTIRIRGRKLMLRDIKPTNVIEEEENSAIDKLFDSKEVYLGKKTTKNRTKILNKNRNRLELEIEEPEADDKIEGPLMVTYNVYNLVVQKAALEKMMNAPQKHMIPLINLLQQRAYVNWEDFENMPPQTYGILADQTSPGTAQQMEFVKIALGTSDFAILEGPPGSGKTSTILEIILNLCASGKKILMVASTHVAVDNVLERLLENKNGHENLMDKFGVIPLRIGDQDSVSDKVKRFTLDNRIATEKSRIRSFLGGLQTLTEAQRVMYAALNDRKDQSFIEQLVVDSSNFICGTTIGILQSNLIKKNARAGNECPFDYMIIDEASKTPFTEFLVPALYAKRWIISGDPKQLSPYVDQEFIERIVEFLPSFARMEKEQVEITKNISIDVFNSVSAHLPNKLRGALVIDETDHSLSKMYLAQASKIIELSKKGGNIPPAPFSLEHANTVEGRLMLLGSTLVIGSKEQASRYWKLIPTGLATRGDSPVNLARRETAVQNLQEIDPDSGNWEYQVTWRLNRAYEMRNDPNPRRYQNDLGLLIPYFLDRDQQELNFSSRILKDLEKIRKTFYPSIIEMLQSGVSDRKTEGPFSIAIYDGLPSEAFEGRHVLLSYQHRMHPEISTYPRSYFYNEKALLDAPELWQTRSWGYDEHYRRRMIWIDIRASVRERTVQPKTNVNTIEVDTIRKELSLFSQRAKMRENSKGEPWKVALLTFYRGQEKELSRMMQDFSGQRGNRRYFNMESSNLNVEVCTVDRFQGQEADIVFLSMVRRRGVGFLDNRNRMNVALTRAKYQMVIVGDKRPFLRSRTEFLKRMAEEIEGPI